MTKSNGVNYPMDKKTIKRRERVIERLEKQLVGNIPIGKLSSNTVSRIGRELFILKQRV